jgi:hypothetical protein
VKNTKSNARNRELSTELRAPTGSPTSLNNTLSSLSSISLISTSVRAINLIDNTEGFVYAALLAMFAMLPLLLNRPPAFSHARVNRVVFPMPALCPVSG